MRFQCAARACVMRAPLVHFARRASARSAAYVRFMLRGALAQRDKRRRCAPPADAVASITIFFFRFSFFELLFFFIARLLDCFADAADRLPLFSFIFIFR